MPLTINLNKFSILEIIYVNLYRTPIAVLIVGLIIDFLLLHRYLNKQKISSFFLGFYSLLLRHVDQHQDHSILTKNKNLKSESSSTKQEKKNIDDDRSVCRSGDVEIVLRSLGLFCNGDQEENNNNNIPASLDIDDIFNIFEEKSVSLDEVTYAFDVFDENRDGFIDAKELQKVLCALGLKEGLEMERCRRMIGVFDENGDGKIDFDEFVKFMENSF
ncbi:probable calcium-binding protein cml45 [Phtheirospermum japonicum]|uniref:Probable calcium-binding protein cml45 n=1 Tax=Phtheirospermum japonicum TaxID=374723 RepID=A0A830CNE8_9LAMI|nr:probable calcium-binding protein cml45 [Phtheirospermum japonicum]